MNDDDPEISVILPYFNAEATLHSAIDSILKQKFESFELVLINNCSTDNSYQVAKNLASKHQKIRLIQENAPGVANAFNKGLQLANGKFIARMDADDTSTPKRLEKQIQLLKDNRQISIVASQVQLLPTNKNRGFQHFVNWSNKLISPEQIALNRFVEQPVVNPSIMCRKEVFETVGSYKHGNFPEDYDWFLRVLEADYQIAKIPEPLLQWNDSASRLSRTDKRYSIAAFYKTKAFYLSKWLKKNNPFYPHIAIWGMGKKSKQRASLLEKYNINITAYIDVINAPEISETYYHFENIPPPGKIFIISYVGNRGAREKIRNFLIQKGYVEGKNFIMAA
ncbi:glycosyltransferase family 2 protein [Chondrinema litorale]|uniref:glycosyltransferase family 2 protein n=1 Tax=Chondrinema litorale TaxID=2994555 RepID=UPI002542F065|nr:glycosyltransferase family 2 protein [Chondrinema litorale]UZR93074.1 glycosyltransferase family 2 protein [Chondrinema litorale]